MTNKKRKVIIFGATGDTGICLVKSGLALGYKVTAFVRNKEKLLMMLGGFVPNNLQIIVGDALNGKDVASALEGHNTAVNAAAHARDMQYFYNICKTVVTQADRHLESPKRLWLFGGVPALTFPHTNVKGFDLPLFPSVFKVHQENYELLLKSNTDWSFMCPGPMVPLQSLDHEEKLTISTEFMPLKINPIIRYLPKIFCSLSFKNHLKYLVVSYEAVANLVMTNLEPNGPYSKKKVGIGRDKG